MKRRCSSNGLRCPVLTDEEFECWCPDSYLDNGIPYEGCFRHGQPADLREGKRASHLGQYIWPTQDRLVDVSRAAWKSVRPIGWHDFYPRTECDQHARRLGEVAVALRPWRHTARRVHNVHGTRKGVDQVTTRQERIDKLYFHKCEGAAHRWRDIDDPEQNTAELYDQACADCGITWLDWREKMNRKTRRLAFFGWFFPTVAILATAVSIASFTLYFTK